MSKRKNKWRLASGAPVCMAAIAAGALGQDQFQIQGGEVNISGATLFRDFYQSKASTNDWIDVDGDNNFYPIIDQLAPGYTPGQGAWTGWWLVQYRGVGSVNGINEFVDWHLCRDLPTSIPSEVGLLNRYVWAETGEILTPVQYQCGETGTPFCPTTTDLATADVPTKWGVRAGDSSLARWNAKPTSSGYGFNPALSAPLDGECSLGGKDNLLATLERNCAPLSGRRSLNTNTNNPDERTVFDETVAFVPVAIIANRGTGVENIRVSQLQYLFISGRLPNGENLAGATRDAGSGTRNACMNPMGIDPSWGVGDHAGPKVDTTTSTNVGDCHQVSNCGGSSIIENAVQQSRLAIGYTGLAGASRAAGDALAGKYEILNTMNDHVGAALYVRPMIDTILDNADPNTGYRIGGSETIISRGDPFELDPNAPAYMDNQQAASYLRNVHYSITEFDPSLPSDPDDYSPGQFLATSFFLEAGCDRIPSVTDPTAWIAPGGFNQGLQNFIRVNNDMGIGSDTPPYGSANAAGLVPVRNTGNYTDGGTDAYPYNVNGVPQTPIQGGKKLSERNRLQGDFNNDGVRNILDIDGMMMAMTDPLNYEQGMTWGGDPGDQTADVVIVHVIGDFNGDGNFDKEDVRYFADGLALSTSGANALDRKAGFTRVDQAWSALTGQQNYFGTVLASGKPYAAGDSRGDIAGHEDVNHNVIISRGANPVGRDGIVDAKDINYIYANFGDWSNIENASRIDLSADMNGDLRVDQNDVNELIENILCTFPGDANLDGSVDGADLAIVNGHLNMPGGWSEGDFNGNGIVDASDLSVCQQNQGRHSSCGGGFMLSIAGDCPGSVTLNWSGATPSRQQGIVYGATLGNTRIPNGQPCAGTMLGIAGNVRLVQVIGTGPNGSGHVSGSTTQPACGGFLQLVISGSAPCTLSNAAQLP